MPYRPSHATLILVLILGVLTRLEASSSTPSGYLPPSEPQVLFNGYDFTGWRAEKGGEIRWTVDHGEMEVTPGSGSIETTAQFTDFFLHAEFKVPYLPNQRGQDRGNSGLYLLGRYEVQILDSFDNPTYFAGHCGSLYQSVPALQPAQGHICRRPEEWQSYDIVFRAPRLEAARLMPGKITVVHNGVLVIDEAPVTRGTGAMRNAPQGSPGPIRLQDHGSRVRFRNLWIQRR